MGTYTGDGLSMICLTFLNAWKQMCSAGGSVPRLRDNLAVQISNFIQISFINSH